MAKDPAFLFYPGDWLSGTMYLTHEQKGAYMDLLILQFNVGKFTEAQAKQVLSICFDVAWPMLEQKFKKEGNFYFNVRLQTEIEKRKNFSESRRNNAKGNKSSKTDKLNTEASAEHMHEHMEDENINENKIEDDNIIIEASKKILTDFGFNEIRNINHLRKISDFLRVLKYQNRLDYFIEIYPAYWEYKKLSGSEPQMLETFLNDGWDRANWQEKLNEIKNKTQGKTNPVSRLEQAQRLYESTRKG